MSLERFPCVRAFDRGDDLALWIWTYRVWNGWRWPTLPWGVRAVALITIALAACSVTRQADPHHPACIVGRDCPDASIDAPTDATYPSCATPIPPIQACTCALYLCSGDGGVEHHDICGPQCDAGVDGC